MRLEWVRMFNMRPENLMAHGIETRDIQNAAPLSTIVVVLESVLRENRQDFAVSFLNCLKGTARLICRWQVAQCKVIGWLVAIFVLANQ